VMSSLNWCGVVSINMCKLLNGGRLRDGVQVAGLGRGCGMDIPVPSCAASCKCKMFLGVVSIQKLKIPSVHICSFIRLHYFHRLNDESPDL
jgi:hypothetical protein